MADTELTAKLLVMDTGPLITLAAADSLAYLLYPDVPVYIPDAVLYEATVKSGALGAENIALWVQENSDVVRPIVTRSYVDFLTLRGTNPTHRERDLGERAALEAIRYGLPLTENERAVLLTEDDAAVKVLVLPQDHERLIPVMTFDFLTGLERAGRINSAEEVYRLAAEAGRHASRNSALKAQHERAQAAVEKLLKPKI
ncbi:MAG: hypothetical protein ACOYL3_26405 [Desulfuromonadaceae bacterium]